MLTTENYDYYKVYHLYFTFMEPPNRRKPLSHRNFAMKFAPYIFALSKKHTSGKNEMFYISKMAVK